MEPEPNPLPWLTLKFSLVDGAAQTLARQIKHTGRTYSLFDLARVLLRSGSAYRMELSPGAAAPGPEPFHLCRTDGTVWLSSGDAVRHILRTQLDRFYRAENVRVDPPKGNFTVIAVCGLSGTLLGPPNLHDYERRLRELHARRYARMPWDDYRGRVRMERDPVIIEKWKEEASEAVHYFPKPAAPEDPAETPGGESAAPAEPVLEPLPAEAAVASEEPAAESSENPVTEPEEAVPEGESSDAPAAEEPAVSQPVDSAVLRDLAAVEAHFLQHHAADFVTASAVCSLAGDAVVGAPLLKKALDLARREEERYPLRLAQALSKGLANSGLRFHKSANRTTYVSASRPRHLDLQEVNVSDSIRRIVEHIRTHRNRPRTELLEVLAPLPAGSDSSPAAAPEASGDTGERASTPAETTAPSAAELIRANVVRDLLWLTHEGYVIEYADGRLEAVPPPKTPAPKPNPVAPTAEVPAEAAPSEASETPQAPPHAGQQQQPEA